MLKFLRIVAEIRNDAISLSHECHKSIVKSTGALSHSYSLFCILFSVFPFPIPIASESNQYAQDALLYNLTAARARLRLPLPVPPVALCPSLAPTGSTSSYDSVWEFALPAQAQAVSVCGMHRV